MPDSNLKSQKDLLAEIDSLRKENAHLHKQIEENDHFYEVIGLMSAEMFWQTDSQHRFSYMSPAVVDSVDMPMTEQLGKTRAELANDDLNSAAWRRHLDDLKAHRPFRNFIYTRRHSSGEIRKISATGRPVFDDKGEFHGYIGVASDITQKLKMEAKAKSAQDMLMTAINALDFIFAIWDADDRLVFCNEHFKRLNEDIEEFAILGTSFEEHIRAVVFNGLTDPNHDTEVWMKSRLDRHRNPRGPFEITRQGGLTLLINEAKLEDGSTITMTNDITQQKQIELALRESQQRLLDFSSTSADWFWEMDKNLRYTYVSLDDPDITGLPVTDFIGRTHREINPNRFSEQRMAAFEQTLINRESFSEIRYSHLTADLREVHVSISGKPVYDDHGEFKGYRGGGRNIVGLVETEEALRHEKERAEQASRAKSEFLAHMSHELRTPLNAILGFSDIISQQLFGPVGNDSYTNYAVDIHQSGKHLLSLINDLLDLSKIEAGKFDLVEEDLLIHDIAKKSERLFSQRFTQRRISYLVQIDDDAQRLYADPRALSQMFFNLLSNAEKFSENDGKVEVMVNRSDDGGICIQIRDTGCGFRINDTETALAPFGRIENPMTKERPGTGLGLPIVSSLIALHQGQLKISSEIGVGTEVVLLFPPERTR